MSERDRRALWLGALVVGFAWLALRGAPRATTWLSAVEDELGQRALLLERARTETRSLATLSDSIAVLEEVAGRLDHLLLVGTDAGTAGFDLTRRTASVISRSAAWVASTDVEPDTVVSGPLARATVRAQLETDVVGLMTIVRNLELEPSLAVRSVTVEAEDPAAPAGMIERLRVQLAVSGWFHRADTTSTLPAPESRG